MKDLSRKEFLNIFLGGTAISLGVLPNLSHAIEDVLPPPASTPAAFPNIALRQDEAVGFTGEGQVEFELPSLPPGYYRIVADWVVNSGARLDMSIRRNGQDECMMANVIVCGENRQFCIAEFTGEETSLIFSCRPLDNKSDDEYCCMLMGVYVIGI